MQQLKKLLKLELKGVKRLGVLGIGSELRGDDIFGLLVVSALNKKNKRKLCSIPFEAYFGSTAPESVTGEIKKFKPTHLIIVDAAATSKKPGSVILSSLENENPGAAFATHRLPLKMLVEYLNHFFPCKVMLLGIQPKHLNFGKVHSKMIQDAARKVAGLVLEILGQKIGTHPIYCNGKGVSK